MFDNKYGIRSGVILKLTDGVKLQRKRGLIVLYAEVDYVNGILLLIHKKVIITLIVVLYNR
jgi:hypothetical protein